MELKIELSNIKSSKITRSYRVISFRCKISTTLPNHRLPLYTVFAGVGLGLKKAKDGRIKMWYQSIK